MVVVLQLIAARGSKRLELRKDHWLYVTEANSDCRDDVTDAMEKLDLPDSEAFAKVKEAVSGKTDVADMIRAGAAAISDAEKLELAKAFLTAYQDKLCEKGNSLLAKKRLPATVASVRLD